MHIPLPFLIFISHLVYLAISPAKALQLNDAGLSGGLNFLFTMIKLFDPCYSSLVIKKPNRTLNIEAFSCTRNLTVSLQYSFYIIYKGNFNITPSIQVNRSNVSLAKVLRKTKVEFQLKTAY